MTPDLDRLAVDTIRTLAIDGVQKANSGHPGAPMGAAPMAYAVWTRFLRHAPTHPDWPDRDRFVLSAGHASMLLYSLLHLTGYAVSMEDLQSFRQWGSITPGHPEYGVTPGVEATTGPLGPGPDQRGRHGDRGAASGGRVQPRGAPTGRSSITGRTSSRRTATSRKASRRRPPAWPATCVSASSSCCYDDNLIQLDGPTKMAWSEDVPARFDAYGWHTQRVADGNDVEAITAAIEAARADDRPSLIAVRTHIGFGSPNKQDSQKAHGAPLGVDEVRLTKEAYGWDPDRSFYVPGGGRRAVPGRGPGRRGARRGLGGHGSTRYAAAHPADAAAFSSRMAGDLTRRLGRRAQDLRDRAPRSRHGTPARTPSRRWPAASRPCSAAPRTCPSPT